MASLQTLKQWAGSGQLSSASVADGKVTVGGISLDMTEPVTVDIDGKSYTYSIGSLYLQMKDPTQGLLTYRNACKAAGVKDPIKALDKKIVVAYFSSASVAAPPPTEPAEIPESQLASQQQQQQQQQQPKTPSSKSPHRPSSSSKHKSSKDREKRRREKDRDKRRHDKHKRARTDTSMKSPSQKKSSSSKKAMTNEQVLDNLNVVVDKRLEGLSEMDQEIHQALSATGFEVPNLTPEGRKEVQELTNLEIPVGNSASILRPAPGRDFRKALELYQETMDRLKNKGKKKSAVGLNSGKMHLRGKRPIIILPKGMQPPLTMLNAFEFFGNRKYLARDKVLALKRTGKQTSPPPTTFRHALDARNGKGVVDFELMDNPKNKLGHDLKEWDRVVCVVSLGAAWQFKDWPNGYNNPVDLFQRTKGVFFTMEGDKIPTALQKWRVEQFKLHRDKRGMDSVTWASFWKVLEEFMAVHKRELFPENE